MDNYEYYISSIEKLLRIHQRGMTISEIALDLHMSRNTVGKYLELMYQSGVVDARAVGKAKKYFLAPRVPATRVLSYFSDAVIQTDNRYRIVNVNLAALDLLGGDEDELTGRNLLDLFCILGMTGDMRGKITGSDRDDAFTAEMGMQKEGRDRIFWMTVADMVMYDGVPGHIFILDDITEWKAAEEKRLESEFLFSTLAEETFEQVCLFSPDFTIRYGNPRYASAARRTDDTLEGSGMLKSFDKKAAQMLRDATDSVLELRSPWRMVFPVTENSSVRWLDTRLYPVPHSSGSIETILGIIRDVTGFQEGGSASALLSVLLNTMAEGVLTVTVGGTILSWNRGAEMITGYPAEELLGGLAQIIIPPELNGGLDVITDAVRGNVVSDLKMMIRAKGGRKKKVILSSSVVLDHADEISMVLLIWREH